MAAEKWTRERRRELTRTALIDAATEVFARRGFEGASLDEIAATAGFTRGAIYKNFGGKDDLFLAVCDRLDQRALKAFDELTTADAADSSGGRQLAALWQQLDNAEPDLFVLHLEFRLYATRNPVARERFVAHRRATIDLVAQFVRAQTGEPLDESTARALAEVILAVSHGFEHAAIFDPPTREAYELFVEMLMSRVNFRPARRSVAKASRART